MEEIDLKDLFNSFWIKKNLIIAITFSFFIFSIAFALFLPNIYTSQALLAQSNQEESFASKLGSYSSLAGIAGISIPGESNGKGQEAIARIKSFDFFKEEFIPNIKLEDLMAAKRWNMTTNSISYKKRIFDFDSKKWVRRVSYPKDAKPSLQEAYEEYIKILEISEDKRTLFITISIDHVSPYVAESWLNLIIKSINNYMRELDKTLAKNSIDFLNSTSKETNLSEIKEAIAKLLESQIQILMLAEATDYYVLQPISKPLAPEKKSSPSRLTIVVFSTMIGLIISLLLITIEKYFIRKVT